MAPIVGWIASTAASGDSAPDNVDLASEAVGGLSRAEVVAVTRDLATQYAAVPVTVVAGEVTVTSSAAALGLMVDQAATVEQVMTTGDDGFVVTRFTGWLWSFVKEREVEPTVTLDEATARTKVDELLRDETGGAVEPSFEVRGGELVAIEGQPGLGIETADVIAGLHTVAFSTKPVRVEVASRTIDPRYSLADAEALVDQANTMTGTPIDVKAGELTVTLGVPTLRSLLVGSANRDGLSIGLNPALTEEVLAAELASATVAPQNASISIVDGVPRPVPGHPGAECCAPGATDVLFAALQARPSTAVELPMKEIPPAMSTEQLEALGLREVVASFTTRHPSGQPRVTNIHRMADLVRGTIIRPGQTLSVNELVGKRTVENGFVAAPAISDGLLTDEVGGGISQFATTLFNAAFFAGLDYGQYQSHTLYISRYPYGREATLGYPAPDLQIQNTTPYGILIWPSYTNSSVTVTLFSTKHFASVEQTGQTTGASGVCTSVRTERTRVYLDGTEKVDYVRARYRPSEGINCDGSGPGTTTTSSSTTVAAETTVPQTTVAPPPTETTPSTAPTVPPTETIPTTVLLLPSVPPEQTPPPSP
jgi:vancomycin resistance protein YoaR